MDDNRKVINLKEYREQKVKLEARNFIYIPMAYRQSCLDIVRRHNSTASKQEIYFEFERCLEIAKHHNFPSKALLSTMCYGYFCPDDIQLENTLVKDNKQRQIKKTLQKKLKGSDVFMVLVGISAICSVISRILTTI